MAHKLQLSISDLIFTITSDTELELHQDFLPFIKNQEPEPDYQIEIRAVDSLPEISQMAIASDYDHEVYQIDDHSFIRRFHDQLRDDVYAVSQCEDLSRAVISYLPSKERNVKRIHQIFRMGCWEGGMIRHNRLLLHASLIDSVYGGILFAGPSGIGKSTQADLWVNSRNAKLINGDRPILRKTDRWLAYGSPLAGSSHCCLNEHVPVRAIVVLKQADQCEIHQISKADAFRLLYGLSTVYYWSREYVERTIQMVEDLTSEIPVYQLSCAPNLKAVEILEDQLRENA